MSNPTRPNQTPVPKPDPQSTVPVSVRHAQHTRPVQPRVAPPPPSPQQRLAAPRIAPPPPNAAQPLTRRPQPPQPPIWARTVGVGRMQLPVWVWGIGGLIGVVGMTVGLFLLLGMAALGSDQILPGVSVGGVRVGGLTEDEAVRVLESRWSTLRLSDSGTGMSWQISADELGLQIDAATTAEQAYRVGRSDGRFFAGLLGVNIQPAGVFDGDAARTGLGRFIDTVSTPPQNAGIALENGVVRATPAREGRAMDLDGTLAVLTQDPLGWLNEGRLPLRMVTLPPSVTDSSQLVSQAEALLSQSLTLNLFDPYTGSALQVTTPPEVWSAWLTAQPDDTSSLGVRLALDDAALRGFISQADAQAGDYRYLKTDELAEAFQTAVRGLQTTVEARVYHEDRPRVVQAGETIISIAYQEGVPYPWIQQRNGGISNINAGQTLIIPSPDNFFQFEPVRNKRVVISISQQRAWVYENGVVKWEWTVSTGVNDSPTWPGVYQIISHYPNAYAANWNLYMPWFLGIYQPVPGADFTNGFHGYPTRSGGQILWRNSLGTKVTYGCIMLDDANARLLYEWAENGVIVEIQA